MNIAKTETAVCGGSNLKAPMKLDFLRSLCAQDRHAWPEVVLCRVEGEPLPGSIKIMSPFTSLPSESISSLVL